MALTKIKKANKKHRREQRRKAKRSLVVAVSREQSIRYKRSRKILVQGQKEYNEKRRAARNYVDELASEL